MRLELATLHSFLSVVLIQGGLNLFALGLDRLLDGFGGTMHGTSKTTNGTLPLVIFTVIILFNRLSANEEIIFVELPTMAPEERLVLFNEIKLHSDAVDDFVLEDLVEAVAHDGNQHVQHC